MAAEPLSNGAAYQSVPESYVLPADKRPGSSPSSAAAIPVVDLGGDDPDRIVKQIMGAGREFGFFQVINHGVPGQVMGEMMSSAEEFFGLPTEEKMVLYSTDSKKLPRFHTSIGNDQEKLLYWRDCLKLGCYPFEQFRHQWPQKPARLRAALEAYTTAVRAVALRLLRLTAAGLGLDEGHFEGELTALPRLDEVAIQVTPTTEEDEEPTRAQQQQASTAMASCQSAGDTATDQQASSDKRKSSNAWRDIDISSKADECITERRDRDVIPLRRSFSMGEMAGGEVHLQIHNILQRNTHFHGDDGDSSSM
ncbi:hypothetical protein C2845_PM12G31160 [Panicum miliaceum]|uniref:Non-haem dioxygenase N-terminal domain-containing protein n=1 Tax=Panicum miliaceum TaxID=4540 RepID=A0A3L6QCY6_PANMI|nr:hypothetical protein C2845_PM12G31160 [Panicum miliaceum]